jgi:hypothetical protein
VSSRARRSLIATQIFACLASVLFVTSSASGIADSQVVAERKWIQEMQAIGVRYRKGATTAETNVAKEALVDALNASQAGRTVGLTTYVKDVTWREGVATIKTQRREPLPPETPLAPLHVIDTSTFDLMVSEADALAIKPGMRLELEGKLDFHPYQWGAVGGSTKSQQLSTLTHKSFAGTFLGTFTTKAYRVKVGGKEYRGRWAE